MRLSQLSDWAAKTWFDLRAARHLRTYPDDYLAVASIKAGRDLGGRSARHNAELVSGQSVSDSEWCQFCGSWDRAWARLVG